MGGAQVGWWQHTQRLCRPRPHPRRRSVSRHSPPDRGCVLGRQALYKLSSESRSIMRGCSSDMCSAAWVPDGVALRESSQRSVDGARQLQRSNVVGASPLRKKSSAAAAATLPIE